MRDRTEILKDLVELKGNLSDLKTELSQFPWDVENPLLIVTKDDFCSILKRCIDEDITFEDLENWADIIECRDDLDFEVEEMQEYIFELASSYLYGIITKERLKDIINDLS